MNKSNIAFEMSTVKLSLDQILPIRQLKDPERLIRRYASIVSSVKDQGLVEPLVVFPKKGSQNIFLLIDGHLRYSALKDLKVTSAECIIAKDDESYTYNTKINRLAPIQEHKMIMKAVQNGVAPERIAKALGLRLEYVRSSINLLEGLHEEAVELLKDKVLSPKTLSVLKRVSGIRQIEIAELMTSANNFSAWYAEALLISTPKEEFKNCTKPKTRVRITPEEIACMEQEMECLEKDFKAAEDNYGENNLALTLIMGYSRKLIQNAKVVGFMKRRHPDLLTEFKSILG